jgi:hypothetical protein
LENGSEFIVGDESDFRSGMGDGGHDVRLVSDETRQAEQGTHGRLQGELKFLAEGVGDEGRGAFQEDVKAGGWFGLPEEDQVTIDVDGCVA